MDLTKRRHLSPAEKMQISQRLQIYALEAISDAVHDMQGRLMFHGGTSISTVHDSPRWSEDLDFMINPEMSNELYAVHGLIEENIQKQVEQFTPGAKFRLIDKGKARGKVREADPGTVMSWTGRWEHPSRVGVVKMKTEFYIAEPEAAARYRTEMSLPSSGGIESETFIPAATLDTIWADKIMAMSARPVMKWRDVYDMGFVMDNMEAMDDSHLFDRLRVACQSYRSDMTAIYVGLGRDYLQDLDQSVEVFMDDMKSWLPADVFLSAEKDGSLISYHQSCIDQIERARAVIADRVPDAVTISEEDFSCGF